MNDIRARDILPARRNIDNAVFEALAIGGLGLGLGPGPGRGGQGLRRGGGPPGGGGGRRPCPAPTAAAAALPAAPRRPWPSPAARPRPTSAWAAAPTVAEAVARGHGRGGGLSRAGRQRGWTAPIPPTSPSSSTTTTGCSDCRAAVLLAGGPKVSARSAAWAWAPASRPVPSGPSKSVPDKPARGGPLPVHRLRQLRRAPAPRTSSTSPR